MKNIKSDQNNNCLKVLFKNHKNIINWIQMYIKQILY